ncbi:pilus assembly protein N-terminal domain-containing protein [Ruminococcus sp.]|uniref:pilus assembly protein N-terminal domain-containing protein n=1 Tax=unclassified Ruminococcus TaxID=2608920 RepID=UPI002930979E|nr:pilus assembly protein N-terminal domain-containing protein [Ruminococcus sp.]MBQ1586316.1 pilus assembly protein N-terminal domain-containing protein [Ruminococcus sp.]MBQ1838163.1 pilus assembly protein N-terminal domain-containing protein [Ruminococcus sp.]MBQ1974296.1 pilus assembly protein N-terminal domain-containing protein [Ruminococcus sp.]MBQ2488096.1 pilus assembly protein N-terminal domain-containing protein [Ruminococcus sp.]MBQ2569906.1 pilus assembly protein N-terminal domain
MENKNILRRFTDKLFGGLNMSWPVVIIFAVATAVVTAVFLIVPVFQNTSFIRMGETMEAWVLFAIIIMSNCKKPLESALKTFVFFLISQPLIYLLQVPFSEMGFGLFMYYKYWAIWTVLTFPMAFVGWFITKRNWLSLLILSPILFLLMFTSVNSFMFTFRHFPHQLITALFCLAQIVLYLYAFTPKWIQRAIGFFVPLIAVIAYVIVTPKVSYSGNYFLPDEPVLSDQAVVTAVENPNIADIRVLEPDQVYVDGKDYGTSDFTITDGDKAYHYSLEIYEDDEGHSQLNITKK